MDRQRAAEQPLRDQEPRSGRLGKTIAAYAYFFVAGMLTASLPAWILLGFNGMLDIPHLLEGQLRAGAAAVIGAVAVHRPFLRAARERRRLWTYHWVLLGVLASHLAFGLFPLLLNFTYKWSEAWAVVLFSLIFGFIPNMLWGIGFAEGQLWVGRKRRASTKTVDIT